MSSLLFDAEQAEACALRVLQECKTPAGEVDRPDQLLAAQVDARAAELAKIAVAWCDLMAPAAKKAR